MALGNCQICNNEMLPEEYGFHIKIKSLDFGTSLECLCCNDCFYKYFNRGVIAIGDGAYQRIRERAFHVR